MCARGANLLGYCSHRASCALRLPAWRNSRHGVIHLAAGAGDRLGLRDEATGECLPSAMLPYCGRTMLEALVRDLQAREHLYWHLTGEPGWGAAAHVDTTQACTWILPRPAAAAACATMHAPSLQQGLQQLHVGTAVLGCCMRCAACLCVVQEGLEAGTSEPIPAGSLLHGGTCTDPLLPLLRTCSALCRSAADHACSHHDQRRQGQPRPHQCPVRAA
jgi:hypothetical protein